MAFDEILVCTWCDGGLRYVAGRGWTHLGGGVYVQRCPKCGWRWSRHPSRPTCYHDDTPMVDDHAALPVPPTMRPEQIRDVVRADV